MHFNPFYTVFIIQDSDYNHDLSSNDKIWHRKKIMIFNKETKGNMRGLRDVGREKRMTCTELDALPSPHPHDPKNTLLYRKSHPLYSDWAASTSSVFQTEIMSQNIIWENRKKWMKVIEVRGAPYSSMLILVVRTLDESES